MTIKTKTAALKKVPDEPVPVTTYFKVGDAVLIGKYKNSKALVVGFGEDKWGNPTIEVEPIPKGRKKNKIIGLFRIWRADVKA